MSNIVLKKQTAASIDTPATDKITIFVDSADGKQKIKKDNGSIDIITTNDTLVTKLDSLYFGDGSDGDVIINTTVTLVRDMYYNNLTITSPGILNPNGYRIYVKGTLSGDGKIQRNGNNGANGSDSVPNMTQAAGGAALNAGTLNADVGGSNGGIANYYGSTGVDPNGVAGISSNPSYTNIIGAKGGNGGASTGPGAPGAGGGGAGGIATRGGYYNVGGNPFNWLFRACGPASFVMPSFTQYKIGAGAGGGGGGSNGQYQAFGGGGGGGGGNGGFIWASINIVNRTGTWEAKGGKGGNGGSANPTYQTTSSVGGGGGGGAGGVIYLLYRTLTSMGTETLTGGLKGTPGTIGLQPTVFAEDGQAGLSIKIPV